MKGKKRKAKGERRLNQDSQDLRMNRMKGKKRKAKSKPLDRGLHPAAMTSALITPLLN